MTVGIAIDRESAADAQVEFFGFRLRVMNPRLAALLTGDEDDVQVLQRDRPCVAEAEAEQAAVSWRAERADSGGVVVQLRRPALGL